MVSERLVFDFKVCFVGLASGKPLASACSISVCALVSVFFFVYSLSVYNWNVTRYLLFLFRTYEYTSVFLFLKIEL